MRKFLVVACACFTVAGTPALTQAVPAPFKVQLVQSKPALSGAKLYQAKCSSCHSIPANKIGPAHKGVFGRTAGQAPGYSYSAPLKGSGIVWNDKTLDLWLQGPQKVVKGSKMFVAVPNAAERAAIIAYLKSPAAK